MPTIRVICVPRLAVTVIIAGCFGVTAAGVVRREESPPNGGFISEERWHTPCAGTRRVDDRFAIHDNGAIKMKKAQLLKSCLQEVEKLLGYSEDVSTQVKDLRDNFLATRFKDTTQIGILEGKGDTIFNITEYAEAILGRRPNIRPLNSRNLDQVVLWVQESVKKFSWVAAYMELAREEESPHERTYFRHQFERSEEQAYWILCTLYRIMYHIEPAIENQLAHIVSIPNKHKLKDFHNLRDQRDYLALRDYSRFMDRFKGEIRCFLRHDGAVSCASLEGS